MAVLAWRSAPGTNILQPAMPSGFQRMDPWAFAPSIQMSSGQAVARQTANGLGYPTNRAATDGTQIFGGFLAMSIATDASGFVYIVASGSSAGSNYYVPLASNAPVWTSGIFDPNDVSTGYTTGSLTAEVDTVVIGGTLGATDSYAIASSVAGAQAIYAGGNTNTSSVATELGDIWTSNPVLTSVATVAVSNNTITITGANPGYALGISVGKQSTSGTITLAQTTAPVAPQTAEVDTWTLSGTAPTANTGTFTLTITYPGSPLGYLGNTLAVTATMGATGTIAAATALIAAAWNANPQAAAYATATSTATTVVLTAVVSGSAMNVAMTTNTSTTITKTVTTPAFGRNITDIQNAGRPGAYVLQSTGYWAIP